MTADRDQLRQQLAEESARHHLMIGVDQRVVMCVCGWSSTDEANLRRPIAPYGQHVATALLPVVEAHAALTVAAELVYAAKYVYHSEDQEGYRWMTDRAFLWSSTPTALRTHQGDTDGK